MLTFTSEIGFKYNLSTYSFLHQLFEYYRIVCILIESDFETLKLTCQFCFNFSLMQKLEL